MPLLNGIRRSGRAHVQISKNQQGIQNKSIAIAVTWLMPDKSLDIVADKIRKII